MKASHRDKVGPWEIQRLTEHIKEVEIFSLKKKKCLYSICDQRRGVEKKGI